MLLNSFLWRYQERERGEVLQFRVGVCARCRLAPVGLKFR